MILYTYNQFQNEIGDMLDDHMSLFVDNIFFRIHAFFSRVRELSGATIWMGMNHEEVLRQRMAISLQFMGLLSSFPQIKKFNISMADGSFFAASRIRRGSTYAFEPSKSLPPSALYRITFVDTQSVKDIQKTCRYYDDEGQCVGVETKTFCLINPESKNTQYAQQQAFLLSLYDPRTTTWYQEAKKQKDFYWSDMYRYLGSGEIRMTAAQPMYDRNGKFVGVASADVLMSELANLLKQNSLGPVAASFLINSKGECFAYPIASAIATLTETGIDLEKAEDITAFYINDAYKRYQHDRNIKNFLPNKNSYQCPQGTVYFLKFPESLGANWTLGVALRTNQFLEPLTAIYDHSLIFCFLMLLVSTALLIVISNRISSPIEAVADSLRRIQNLEFNITFQVYSRFYELSQMIDALKGVVNGLRNFGKFVPKNLVKQLVRTGRGIHLGGDKRKITVLFSDIQDFTAISEKINPEILLFHLSDYFEEMTSLITGQHGTLDKYIGDAIMAFWGAPVSDERQGYRACSVALACTERLNTLNPKWIEEKKPALHTRFGINTGFMLVGNMGSSDRLQYTVLGDAVNLTARLEQLNKTYGTKILVSESTYAESKDDFVFRPVDFVAVKGKQNGVRIYELMGWRKYNTLDESLELAEKTEAAYTLYAEQKWKEAREAYLELLNDFPEDHLAKFFVARCEALIETPPKSWDGLIKMTVK